MVIHYFGNSPPRVQIYLSWGLQYVELAEGVKGNKHLYAVMKSDYHLVFRLVTRSMKLQKWDKLFNFATN